MAATNYNNSQFGLPLTPFKMIRNDGSNIFAMAATNSCFAFRFSARSTKDIKAVRVRWGTITGGGVVEVRIETTEATTRPIRPTGTLYDAAATVNLSPPTTGLQTATFATLPTAGLVVGTVYAIVLLTTTPGTAHPLHGYITESFGPVYPAIVMTATDGSISGSPASRANMAEVGTSVPLISIVYEDDTEEDLLVYPWGVSGFSSNAVYGAVTASAKMVTSGTILVDGAWGQFTNSGTPAGDIIATVYEADGTTPVAGASVTLDKDSFGTLSSRGINFLFNSAVQLAAGTYYIKFTSPDSDSSNRYNLRGIAFNSAAGVAAHRLSTSAAGDSTTEMASGGFLLNDVVAGGGGGRPEFRGGNL